MSSDSEGLIQLAAMGVFMLTQPCIYMAWVWYSANIANLTDLSSVLGNQNDHFAQISFELYSPKAFLLWSPQTKQNSPAWRLRLGNEWPHYTLQSGSSSFKSVLCLLFFTLNPLSTSALHSCVGLLPWPSARTRECVFVRARTPAWLCICASLFTPVKSCYRRQQQHCSPPMQPPWHNSLQPLAHMIAPHCSRLLLLARPDLPLKSKGGLPRPLWPFYFCLLWGRRVNTSRWLGLNLNVSGQKAGRQIGVERKDGLYVVFFFSFILPVLSKRLINPYGVGPMREGPL